MSFFYVIAGVFFCLGIILVIRNEMVYKIRMNILLAIREEINLNGPKKYDRLVSEYDKVSYNRMVLSFWKRPRSFYTELLDELKIWGGKLRIHRYSPINKNIENKKVKIDAIDNVLIVMIEEKEIKNDRRKKDKVV